MILQTDKVRELLTIIQC